MAFWSKDGDEDKREEMEEIKKKVGGNKTSLPKPPGEEDTDRSEPTGPPEPPKKEGKDDFSEMPRPGSVEPSGEEEIDERSLPDTSTVRAPSGGDDEFAPLFVKIDKYRQVLQNLEQIKNTLNDLKELFTLMNHIDDVKREGMGSLKQGISDLADALVSMDEKFIRPEGAEEYIEEPGSGVSRTVEELRDELKGVRDDLDRL